MTNRKRKKQDKDWLRFFIILDGYDVPVEICDMLIYASRDNEIACDTIGAIQVRTYFSGICLASDPSSICFKTHLLEPDQYGPDEDGKHWFRPIAGSPSWRSWPREQALARHARVVQAVKDGDDLIEDMPT